MSWTPLQKKIFVLVVGLFSLVYTLTLFSIYSAAYNQAEREFNTRLNVGRNVFLNELTVTKANFDSNVKTIAKDWALRSAIGKGVDQDSIISIMANHSGRIDADAALIVNNEYQQVAVYSGDQSTIFQPQRLNLADQDKQRAWLGLLNDEVYLVSAEPIMAPGQIGWLVMARKLDADFLERVKKLISLDINLLVVSDKKRVNPLSTMESEKRGQYWLSRQSTELSTSEQGQQTKADIVKVDQEELIVLPFVLTTYGENKFILVLQDSFSDSLKSFNTFLLELVPFFIIGILLAIVGSYYIARSITRPVGKLLDAAKRIASGHYTEKIRVSGKSELGELASEFTHMQEAVMERELKIKDQAEQIKQANRNKFELAIANKQKQMAEEATRTKSRFLANVSHEIRTPLNAMIGYSEMLNDENASQAQKNTATKAINSSGKHLLNIVNDVLDVSKIEADKLTLEYIDIDLIELIQEVKSQMQGQAEEKGIKFELYLHYPLPAAFNSDPTRLRQILFNLCNNALKFTDKGEVSLRVFLNQLGRQIQFDVRDTGMGMSQEQQSNLFTAFAQADQSTSRKYGGTGLGLYICKELVELLGGSIRVESEQDIGSTFSVFIPWHKAQDSDMLLAETKSTDDTQQESICQPDVPSFNAHILCADDNQDNRTLLAYLLDKTGARLTFVENGKQAIQAATEQDIDLILMDMQMPEMDGLEATTRLKQDGFEQPIVMLTANVDQASKALVYASGADGHIGKPFDTADFYACVQSYLNKSA